MKPNLTRLALMIAALALPSIGAHAAGVLTGKDGMTLYIFDKDMEGMSKCEGDCAVKWPPYLGKEGETLGEDWTLVKRADGTMQWAYEGKPVYFYIDDKKAGDVTGDGKGGVWHVIAEE